MNTLLIPIDFSENALEATQYAMGLLPLLHSRQVVFYHSHTAKDDVHDILLKELEEMAQQFRQNDTIEIICEVNHETLTEGISTLVRQHGVSLIIMGITGRNKVGQKLIGSNVFKVSQNIDIPILVVPAKSPFVPIENIALALPIIPDLPIRVPEENIKTFVKTLGANLMVVNVGRENEKMSKAVLYTALKDMLDMFEELDPSYHFLTNRDTASSVIDCIRDNNAQLLISISGKYGFLEGMFKSSVTQKLAYNSIVPLLIYRSGQ